MKNLIINITIIKFITLIFIPHLTFSQVKQQELSSSLASIPLEAFYNSIHLKKYQNQILDNLKDILQFLFLSPVPYQLSHLSMVQKAKNPELQALHLLTDYFITQAPSEYWIFLREMYYYDRSITFNSKSMQSPFGTKYVMTKIGNSNSIDNNPSDYGLNNNTPSPKMNPIEIIIDSHLKNLPILLKLLKNMAILEIIMKLKLYDLKISDIEMQEPNVNKILFNILYTLISGFFLDDLFNKFPELKNLIQRELQLKSEDPRFIRINWWLLNDSFVYNAQFELKRTIFGPFSGDELIIRTTAMIEQITARQRELASLNFNSSLNHLKKIWEDYVSRSPDYQLKPFEALTQARIKGDSFTLESKSLKQASLITSKSSICSKIYSP